MSAFVKSTLSRQGRTALELLRRIGTTTVLGWRSTATLFTTRFEMRAFVYQLDQLGVKSMWIAAATAIFVSIVMTVQFAFSLERFGAQDSVPRIIGLSEARELAPALTALVVGCRIGAGIAAELGSMAVTEQIDAIRALGADPIRKLVVPRVLAGMVVMPLLCTVARARGLAAAMIVSKVSFGISMPFFISTAFDTIELSDFMSGIAKTPIFGYLVCLVGCQFGLTTRGGTEGVGRSTTASVVACAITVLVADAITTQVFLNIFHV